MQGPGSLAPAPGVTPPDTTAPPHRFLSDVLVARGLVSQEQMDAALDASRAGADRRYSQILVADGVITEHDLARALADHYRIDHVDLDVFALDPRASGLISRETARRLGALPIALLPGGDVAVAVHDPEALTHLGELRGLLKRDIRPVVAARSQVDRCIAQCGRQPPAPAAVTIEAGSAEAPDLAASAPGIVEVSGTEKPERDVVPATDGPDPFERLAAAGVDRPAAADRELDDALRAAEERANAAEKQAQNMAAAAQAANDALARLAQARLASDAAAQTASATIEALTSALEDERAERRRLEAELRARAAVPPPPAPPGSMHGALAAEAPPNPEPQRQPRGLRRMIGR